MRCLAEHSAELLTPLASTLVFQALALAAPALDLAEPTLVSVAALATTLGHLILLRWGKRTCTSVPQVSTIVKLAVF